MKIKSNGNIVIFDQIIAANKVSIESTNDVQIIPEGGVKTFGLENIRANEVDIAAVGLIENTGALVTGSAYFSSDKFINEGDIETARDIYIHGKSDVVNRFGGVILGENIDLKSERKVTNGSLYPYRLVSAENFTSGISKLSRSVNKEPDFITGGITSVPAPSEGFNKVEVDNLDAFILGQNVRVEAREFINANPYAVSRHSKDQPELILDYQKSSQVIVSAESTLELQLGYRFWNMSAIAESWTGNTIIQAPVIDNERYSLWGSTDSKRVTKPKPDYCNDPFFIFHKIISPAGCRTDKTVLTHSQYIKTLSPQSRLHAGNHLILKSHDLFNEHSVIEAKQDVVGTVSYVWMEGLSLRDVWETTTVTHHQRSYCTKRILRSCRRRRTDFWTTSRADLTKNEETQQFPFVFFVGGHLHKGFGSASIKNQDITYGPYATSYLPKVMPPKIGKPSKYIPIINDGITLFIINPNFKA
ncbi:hypothetical protein ACFFUP_18665 [Vibrio ostreicida]|uniref:Uncharacterized protein n=1 Tax=Vibrio ostreicida TaxID=526588 RepID=A0ABT8BQB8_9VIBR|nr:hypothetical protein [Vibrio ostreicida]MDN3608844.1 hypothetical protein [Vibrio ostreicida]NPD09878.1 hypothetical protein [Vibrio ostreicida]